MLTVREAVSVHMGKATRELSVPSPQICYKPKTARKHKVLIKLFLIYIAISFINILFPTFYSLLC